jgi:Fe-Mn family superoxide dismutase
MDFRLHPLPYAPEALEPWLGRETLRLHHDEHHAGYLAKLEKLIGDRVKPGETLESIVLAASGPVFDNAAQAWNHDFLWRSMAPPPQGGAQPRGALADAIDARFGSFRALRREFLEMGGAHFGSGWLWLVLDDFELRVIATHDADTPLRNGQVPLLTCDLWEHAFYLDYRNERDRYLEAFFDQLANWEFAGESWKSWNAASARR